jgi:hypothetical protein
MGLKPDNPHPPSPLDDDPRSTWGFRTIPIQPPQAVSVPGPRTITHEAWLQEGTQLFGASKLRWVFRCPSCGQVQTVADFLHHHIDPQGNVFRTCLSALLPFGTISARKPCTFTLNSPDSRPELVVIHAGKNTPVLAFGSADAHFQIR